jgi:hypothetical protein
MSEIPRTQNRGAIEFDALFEPLLDSDEAAQIFTGIHMGDCRNRRLHYRWTSVSTRMTSIRGLMRKSVD